MSEAKLALIAGNGELPYELASTAIAAGREMICVALSKEAEKNLRSLKLPTVRYSPVEAYKILEFLQKEKAGEITFIGKVPKLEFFKSMHKLEKRALDRVLSLPDLHDDTLHGLVVDFVELEHRIKVIDQTKYLRKFFPKAQCFSKRQPTSAELEEIHYGMKIAKEMGRLDIGQSVVVQSKSILAVEAIEGTNACIKRARASLGPFARNKRITICKVSKPDQDPRFDVPTLGLATLKACGKDNIVAFEAEQCMFLNQQESIAYADANNICLIAI